MLNLKTIIEVDGVKYIFEVADIRNKQIEGFIFDGRLFLSQDLIRGGEPLVKDSWSKSEINILKENYLDKPMKILIQLLPDRSPQSITHKACRLGLKRRKNIDDFEVVENVAEHKSVAAEQKIVAAEQKPAAAAAAPNIEPEQRYNKKWTKEEDQLLKDNYKKHGAKKFFKKNMLPGRSIGSISSRAYFLKLKKYNTKNELEKTSINFNKTVLAVYHNRIYQQCWNRLLFKLGDSFSNNDLRVIIKKWYSDVQGLVISKCNLENYVLSYKQFGLDNGFFRKTGFGVFRLVKQPDSDKEKQSDSDTEKQLVDVLTKPQGNEIVTEKPDDSGKPTISIVEIDDDDKPKSGYSRLVKLRSDEIARNKKIFEKTHNKEEVK